MSGWLASRLPRLFHCNHSREQDVVFKVNVLVQIGFEVSQGLVKRLLRGCAGGPSYSINSWMDCSSCGEPCGRSYWRRAGNTKLRNCYVKWGVGVEKLYFPPKQPKCGKCKMPRKTKKSFVGHPSAKFFSGIFW